MGVDDSDESRAAVCWAADEARLRGEALWMVHAYSYPMPIAWHTVPVIPHTQRSDRAAEDMVARMERESLGTHPDLIVRRVTLPGTVLDVLGEMSEGADLLVIGAKGRHPLRGVVTGSGPSAVSRRVGCPVVVVHAHDPGPEVSASSICPAAS